MGRYVAVKAKISTETTVRVWGRRTKMRDTILEEAAVADTPRGKGYGEENGED